jgi:hypothetical protein
MKLGPTDGRGVDDAMSDQFEVAIEEYSRLDQRRMAAVEEVSGDEPWST